MRCGSIMKQAACLASFEKESQTIEVKAAMDGLKRSPVLVTAQSYPD